MAQSATARARPADEIGAHMSIEGGLYRALERGQALACGAVQIFLKSRCQWAGRSLLPENVRAFAAARRATGIRHVFAHGSYPINLAAPGAAQWTQAIDARLQARSPRAHRPGVPRAGAFPAALCRRARRARAEGAGDAEGAQSPRGPAEPRGTAAAADRAPADTTSVSLLQNSVTRRTGAGRTRSLAPTRMSGWGRHCRLPPARRPWLMHLRAAEKGSQATTAEPGEGSRPPRRQRTASMLFHAFFSVAQRLVPVRKKDDSEPRGLQQR